jgi:hypothetical protein
LLALESEKGREPSGSVPDPTSLSSWKKIAGYAHLIVLIGLLANREVHLMLRALLSHLLSS